MTVPIKHADIKVWSINDIFTGIVHVLLDKGVKEMLSVLVDGKDTLLQNLQSTSFQKVNANIHIEPINKLHPAHFIETPVPSQESEPSCICVLEYWPN